MPSLRNLTAKAHKYTAFSPNPEADPAAQDGSTSIGLGQPDRTPRIPTTPRQSDSRNYSQGQGAAGGLTPSDSYGKSSGTSPNIGSGDGTSNSLRARITTPLMNDYERGGNETGDESTEDEGDTGKWKSGSGYRMSGNERMYYPSRTEDDRSDSRPGSSVGGLKPERHTGYDARGYPQRSPVKARIGLGIGTTSSTFAPPTGGTGIFDSQGRPSGSNLQQISSRASYTSSAPSYVTHDPTSASGQPLYPPISVQTQDIANERTPSIWSGVTQHSPVPSFSSEAGFGVKENWGQAFKYGPMEGARPNLASAMSSEERLGEALMTSHFAGAGGASLGRKHGNDSEYGNLPDDAISFASLASKLAMGRETNTRSLSTLEGPYALPLDISTLVMDGPDDDDYLHDPRDEEMSGKRSHTVSGNVAYLFSPRGLGNLGCMAILVFGLVTLFAGYPIISSQVDNHATTWLGSYNIGGVNGSGQVPDVIGHFGLIDPDTPLEAHTHTSFETGETWELVFSDEFNTDGRSFYDGDDPYWTAEDIHYAVTNNLEWYDPKAITTENGALKITLSQERNHGLNYTGGMMSTWNKFCFTGGYFVASVSLPGTSDVYGLWPAVWSLGNLARPGYAGTTDGLWPYSYNQCDAGTLRNQSQNGQPELAFTTGDPNYGNTLSYLPGQRLSRCTCENDANHPGPKNSDGSWVGRSAPEIDVIEAQVDSSTRIGHVSQSAQWAPFNPHYWFKNGSGEYTIHDPATTHINPYQGSIYQQATSGLVTTDQDCYTGNSGCHSVYGFEYAPGDNGYITWVSDNKLSWTIRGAAMAANSEAQVGQRQIPDEPMYLILNLGISENFGAIDWDGLNSLWPVYMLVDWVRVYQDPSAINIGCDPADRPTQAYIAKYANAYSNANLTTWEQVTGEKSFPKNRLIDLTTDSPRTPNASHYLALRFCVLSRNYLSAKGRDHHSHLHSAAFAIVRVTATALLLALQFLHTAYGITFAQLHISRQPLLSFCTLHKSLKKMTSPSMQFAPAWLKKPNGTATSGSTNSAGGTPSSNLAFSQAVASAPTIGHLQHSSQNEDPTGLSGFPLPGSRQGGATSTNTGATNALGQSYSQIASPRNESFPSSNQGFGASIASASVQLGDQVNGSYNAGSNKARPFRYSRETMIALFDEDKIRERPLELMEWAMVRSNNSGHAGKENEGVTSIILSDKAGIPMGLVEWTAEEKKLFANPIRRQPAHPDRSDSSLPTTLSSRRNGHLANTNEMRTPGGRGFGRGEGGAFGGGGSANPRFTPGNPTGATDYTAAGQDERRAASGPGTERTPWAPGSRLRDPAAGAEPAFGAGRGERIALAGERRSLRGTARREVPETDTTPRTPGAIGGQASWRPNIRSTPLSGSFEGVLGFSGTAVNKPAADTAADANAASGQVNTWRDRNDGNAAGGIVPSTGGGSGWGKGRWRAAAQEREAADRETTEKRPALAALIKENSADDPQPSISTTVIPPGTPIEQRNQQIGGQDSAAQSPLPSVPAPPPSSFDIDPRNVSWFYTDPSGQQQGPFDATNMQTWFSANYFSDTLPLRREHETSYRTLAVLKEETGTATEPFLTRPVPRFPPNLPIPTSAPQHEANNQLAPDNNISDTMHNLSLGSSPPLMSGQQTPLQSDNFFATQSPAFAQSSINRGVDPFGNTASYHSSPVVQHGRPAWENAVASPAISRAAFGGNLQQEMPHMQHQQAYGGFPQHQYGQARSMFESPQIQSPFAQAPGPVSPWGAPQPAGQMPQMMPSQNFAGSPFQQPIQSPYQPLAGSIPSMQPWHGTPTPQSAVIQHQQQHIQQASFASPVPAPQEAQTLNLEQSSIVDSVLSPVQTQSAVTEAPQLTVSDFSNTENQEQMATQASEPASTSVSAQETRHVESQPEVVAPVALAPALETPAVKETKIKSKGKKAARAAERAAEIQAVTESDAPASPVDYDAASPSAGTPSVAPWANKEEEKVKATTGPSLREIQETEAKAAESRKQDAKAKAAASARVAPATPAAEPEATQTVSWGLPSRTGTAPAVAAPAPSSSPAPVWGSSDAAPKKTLKQIQEEEQRRAKAAAQAKASTAPASIAQQGKRGYADLAATQAPSNASAGAWSTVGASGKTSGPAASVAAPKPKVALTPSVASLPAKPAFVTKHVKASANLDDAAPSVDFIRWCKESLKGLKVNMDEFIQMLLTFPVEPSSANARVEQLEIISDSVYSNSSTLDGRRFAQEFYTKRKADAQNRLANGSQAPAKINSLADIVKTQPKAAGSDFGGFKVVKAKGKGRK